MIPMAINFVHIGQRKAQRKKNRGANSDWSYEKKLRCRSVALNDVTKGAVGNSFKFASTIVSIPSVKMPY